HDAAHELLGRRAVAEQAKGLGGRQAAAARALLSRSKERDPVRLARARGRVAREPGERAETKRGVGDGQEPEPAWMAEGRRIRLSPRANRLAGIVALERPVHRLDVSCPGAQRLDLAEHRPSHQCTSVWRLATSTRGAFSGCSKLIAASSV